MCRLCHVAENALLKIFCHQLVLPWELFLLIFCLVPQHTMSTTIEMLREEISSKANHAVIAAIVLFLASSKGRFLREY